MIRVLLVDDQPLIRTGFKTILETEPGIEVVGEAGDGAQGVERGPDGAPGVEDVVDEDDDLAVNAPLGDLRGAGNTDGVTSQVIAVHGDVQGADRDLGGDLCLLGLLGPLRPFSRGDSKRLDESVREWCSPTGDPEDDDVLRPVVALQNLVRDTEQGTGYIGRSEDLLALDRCARGA